MFTVFAQVMHAEIRGTGYPCVVKQQLKKRLRSLGATAQQLAHRCVGSYGLPEGARD